MHTALKFLTVSIVCFLLLVSCDKFDNDGNNTAPNKNKVTYLGKEYKLKGAVAINFGKDDDTTSGFNYQGYNLDLFFYTEGLLGNKLLSGSAGSGQMLNIDLYASADTLTKGIYTINQSLKIGTADESYFIKVADGAYDYNTAPIFNSGSFSVNQVDSTITIDGVLENTVGDKLEFFYEGKVDFRQK